MPEGKKSPIIFKRGEFDFKNILYEQLDRILEALTSGNYASFVDGVEGLYLSFSYYFDQKFMDKDNILVQNLNQKANEIRLDPRIYPDDKESRIAEQSIAVAKERYANLMLLFGDYKLLLERRRLWDERKPEGSVIAGEPTEDEIRAIIEDSSTEE